LQELQDSCKLIHAVQDTRSPSRQGSFQLLPSADAFSTAKLLDFEALCSRGSEGVATLSSVQSRMYSDAPSKQLCSRTVNGCSEPHQVISGVDAGHVDKSPAAIFQVVIWWRLELPIPLNPESIDPKPTPLRHDAPPVSHLYLSHHPRTHPMALSCSFGHQE
jgi:hypothetical protein